MKNKFNNRLKAFTLVELLVVIAIIGILAAIALVSFTQSQRQARDTTRKSDLKQYQSAIEIDSAKHDGMYLSYQNARLSTTICGQIGLENCPEDPGYVLGDTDSPSYIYSSSGGGDDGTYSATDYTLSASLESKAVVVIIDSQGTISEEETSGGPTYLGPPVTVCENDTDCPTGYYCDIDPGNTEGICSEGGRR